MTVSSTGIPGLLILQPRVFTDARGSFVKTYHSQIFQDAGISFVPAEEFFSISRKGVIRGMHFQLPPAAHDKLVFCTAGRVIDVVLDLRTSLPTFGRSFSCELSAAHRQMMFIPAGLAHGFLSLEDDSTIFYQTSTIHSPAHDVGILWNSFGFDWPVQEPVLSERDRGFAGWTDFRSPFSA